MNIDKDIKRAKELIKGKDWDGIYWRDPLGRPFLLLDGKVVVVPPELENALLVIGLAKRKPVWGNEFEDGAERYFPEYFTY